MSALQDEETQIKGMVAISYTVGQTEFVKGRAQQFAKSSIELPVRFVSIHGCAEPSILNHVVMNFMQTLMKEWNLCRIRIHIGTHTECIYNLLTFGIPKEALPIDCDGKADLSAQHSMLKAFEVRENRKYSKIYGRDEEKKAASSSVAIVSDSDEGTSEFGADDDRLDADTTATVVLVPGPMDVLMGRGRQPTSQPGNMRMRHLLIEHRAAYEVATKSEKTKIAERIVQQMKQSGSRFLSLEPSGFVECEDSVARSKISHGFRHLRSMKGRPGMVGAKSTASIGRSDASTSDSFSSSGHNRGGGNNEIPLATTTSNVQKRSLTSSAAFGHPNSMTQDKSKRNFFIFS